MDAAKKQTKQDRQFHRFAVRIAVLLAFAYQCEDVRAQGASVTPEVKSLSITHSMTEDVQAFPPTRWDISNSAFRNGCVVQWSLAPFTHESNAKVVVDSDVTLRMIRSGRSARWDTTSDYDSTNISAGKRAASVGAASTRQGDGVAELTIRFRTGPVSQLAAGKYHTTLTGTISGL